ncbi:protein CHUP1, chloroplastic-like [Rutidosis leptorrhynchoides]|uniref:protein CHUP1, chloroplastic-like n=1 Tax=Rutidosis leptorrhynchoides TaxID=125765 RepID=UPI003A9949E5
MGNENIDISPVVLKFGVAVALSIGGVFYAMSINRRSKVADCNKQANSRSNIHQASQTSHSSLCFDPLTTDKHEDVQHSHVEKDNHQQEIRSLRNTIRILKERESNLEFELLEYYGLKEQETVVMELQNRLKLNNMEAKIFTLRIESLKADKKRLEAQMTDYKKNVTDLEAARAKIKVLKKKIKLEAEQNRKQILDFQQRVQKMMEDEHKREVSQQKLKGLESEVEELKKSNTDLLLENADLARRLDSAQILATSVLEDAETEKLREENKNLMKQNEDLSKEIERIQADRCADVEEVVYLRWINACLRYELKNYQPGPGKTTARDLSKTLSPKSEEKAKHMILEYANKEGGGEKIINIHEIDSGRWSNSQASTIADFGEYEESFNEDTQPQKNNNNKFFGKLMRVIRGKDQSPNHHRRRNHSRSSSLGDDILSCFSSQQGLTHRHSDSSFYKRIDYGVQGGGSGGSRRSSPSSYGGQKSELVKYADALKDSHVTRNFKSHRSTPSLPLF